MTLPFPTTLPYVDPLSDGNSVLHLPGVMSVTSPNGAGPRIGSLAEYQNMAAHYGPGLYTPRLRSASIPRVKRRGPPDCAGGYPPTPDIPKGEPDNVRRILQRH